MSVAIVTVFAQKSVPHASLDPTAAVMQAVTASVGGESVGAVVVAAAADLQMKGSSLHAHSGSVSGEDVDTSVLHACVEWRPMLLCVCVEHRCPGARASSCMPVHACP